MKCLKPSLIFLMLVAVHAQESEQQGDNLSLPEDENETQLSEEQWPGLDQSYQPEATFSKEQPLYLESQGEVQERAKEEKTFKDFAGYDAIQSVLINALKPKPILDSAELSEKLAPNDGSKTQLLGDFIVKGTETLSKAINSVIDVPKSALYKLSAGATQALNQLGAYLIGL